MVEKWEKARIQRGSKELEKLKAKYNKQEIEFHEVKKFYNQLYTPRDYPCRYLDEIEESQLAFCKYFENTTDTSFLDIPSKTANIYNYSEIEKSSRKDLIISNLLARKIICMTEEEGSKNLLSMDDQEQYVQRSFMRSRLEFDNQESLAVVFLRVIEEKQK